MTDKDTDSTSFASILAGVQRMREQASGTTGGETNASVAVVQVPVASVNPPVASLVQSAVSIDNAAPIPKAPQPQQPRALPINPSPNQHIQRNQERTPLTRTLKRPTNRGQAPSQILVNRSQTGNPLFTDSLMKTTSWTFDSSILSDYYINPKLQILFLSLKYHKLRPEYIWTRLKKLKGSLVQDADDDMLRILLVVVDVDSHQDLIRNLSAFCIKNDLSLVLAWSFEEAGNYIVFAKQQDSAPSKIHQNIRGLKLNQDYNTLMADVLTSVKSVNKTDVSNLLANYKSFKNIVLQTSRENEALNIGGLGATKLKNLNKTFSEPFIYNKIYEKSDK